MSSLKQKTLSGFKWSFIDSFSRYFLTFFISIILARLLTPSDYGLIGMTAIFTALSRVFIDAGFSDALIRKMNPSQEDYSSVFFFNLFLGFIFFLILFGGAKPISVFFNEPRLINLIRVISFGIIISSTALIQVVILRKRLDFKMQTKVSVISTIVSGTISITMAFLGFGVWSLVMSGLLSGITTSLLLWTFNEWRPKKIFKSSVIKEHFSFGSKIMVGSFVNVVYKNMQYVLIGRLFLPAELGYYSKADNFQKLPSENIDIIVRQVTYPALASIQNEPQRLKNTYRTLIKTTSFVVFVLLFGFAAVAEPLIISLIGEKWLPSVPFLQLLCFVGIFFPLISINTNILNVKGRSDLSLRVIIFKVVLSIPSLVLGYLFGIKAMIIGMIGASVIVYTTILFLTEKQIDYFVKEQLSDLAPALIIAILISFPLFIFGRFFAASPYLVLVAQGILGVLFLVFWGILLKNKEFMFFKNIIVEKLSILKH